MSQSSENMDWEEDDKVCSRCGEDLDSSTMFLYPLDGDEKNMSKDNIDLLCEGCGDELGANVSSVESELVEIEEELPNAKTDDILIEYLRRMQDE